MKTPTKEQIEKLISEVYPHMPKAKQDIVLQSIFYQIIYGWEKIRNSPK